MPRDPQWQHDANEHDLCIGQPGFVRIDRTEVIDERGPGLPNLYFHKGGQGYDPGSEASYGHVDGRILAEPPDPAFTKERIDKRGADPGRHGLPGAGRAHPHDMDAYLVRPRPIESDDGSWLYKPKRAGSPLQQVRRCRPGAGERDQHFAYLCWSWLRQDGLNGGTVSGGGAVRALLKDGQVVHRCAVEAMRTPAWNLQGTFVGWVVAVYVRVPVGEESLFGWIVHSPPHPERLRAASTRSLIWCESTSNLESDR